MIRKRFFQWFTFFLLTGWNFHLYAQTEQETQNIATLCKVWGFLKYYHPEVAKGKFDWDKEFMIRVKSASALKSKEETSKFYLEWIESLGEVKKCKKCKNDWKNERWDINSSVASDTVHFTDELCSVFKNIENNRAYYINHYGTMSGVGIPDFRNENEYKDSILPSQNLRYLTLSRYWNVIYYYFPYKYLMDEEWEIILEKMIPKFESANDTLSYHLLLHEMIVHLNDSHASFSFSFSNKVFGDYLQPFYYKYVDELPVISGFYDKELCKKFDLQLGDVVIKANGIEIKDKIEYFEKYISASNRPTFLRKAKFFLLAGFTDSLEIVIMRDEKLLEKTIQMLKVDDYNKLWNKEDLDLGDTIEFIGAEIVYMNAIKLNHQIVDSILPNCLNKNGIILDLRNYPDGSVMGNISNKLNGKKNRGEFAIYTKPALDYPGKFYLINKGNGNGASAKEDYKGKLVLLVDESTQSSAEFSTMMLQTFPGAITVGSQTAGADGNCTFIPLTGGVKVIMTGLGIYYPDGSETQRVGVKVDIEVKPTIQGIREGRDEVLEKAIEVINKQ